MRRRTIKHQFVTTVPNPMKNGVLYISIHYDTCVHRCFCGCGEKVVTPLGPHHWAMTYDGETVSLAPSVGSRTLPCRSHYFIRRDRVRWLPPFTDDEGKGIPANRRLDARQRAPMNRLPFGAG